MCAKSAQEQWDKYVRDNNLQSHLNKMVSIKYPSSDGYYQRYIWNERKRLYFFVPRPSVTNEKALGDSLKNLVYPENISKTYRYIEISSITELFRRDGYCNLVFDNYTWQFKVNDYDLIM